MKKLLITALLAAATMISAGSVLAQESAYPTTASGQVSWTNRYIDRGVVLGNDPSGQLNLNVDNVVIPGIYVSADLATIKPVTQDLMLYSNLGVGYKNNIGRFDYAVSLHNYQNSVFNAGENYNAAEGQVGYTFPGNFRTYLFASQPLTSDDSLGTQRSTYYGGGVQYTPDWIYENRLSLGAQAAFYRYTGTTNSTFNDAQLTASYDLFRNVNVFGLYSFGGNDQYNDPLSNTWEAGVGVKF